MYGPEKPAVPFRAAVGPELVVACPLCAEPKGTACTTHFGQESTGVPHNRRYIAAKMDPYATASNTA